jgi:hypothetical protein
MKSIKQLLTLALVGAVLPTVGIIAQTTKDIFLSETPITYIGIDFSKAKLIGDAAADAYDIKNHLYSAMNQVVVNEPKKYDLNKALSKTTVTPFIDISEAVNSKSVMDSIKSSDKADFQRFSAATIDKMIQGYDFKGKTGIGLVFIMEAMSKPEEKGAIWVTFVNMSTHKVLLTERMLGDAGGFGFRNYWVHTVLDVIEEIGKKKYKQWSATYNK